VILAGDNSVKFMSESRPENDCGLIISPEELLRIQQACIRRRAELEASGTRAFTRLLTSA